MSVQVSYNCWDGTNNGLKKLFHELAVAAGYECSDQGTCYFREGPLPEETKEGIWEVLPEDPIDILLAFNGYDGYLDHRCMKSIADRMIEVLPKLGYGWKRRAIEQFIDGLMDAHEAGSGIRFS